MAKMKAVQVPKAGADFEIVEREIPQPGAGLAERCERRPTLRSESRSPSSRKRAWS